MILAVAMAVRVDFNFAGVFHDMMRNNVFLISSKSIRLFMLFCRDCEQEAKATW